MKISIKWLKQFVTIEESPEEIADMLTMLGLEAEVGLDLSSLKDVITAKVIAVESHPNADKLKLCEVSNGEQNYRVICGAPNVAVDQIVPYARIGTILPGDNRIDKVRIRGEDSYGMICSERELGISDEHEGIMVLDRDIKIGLPISEILSESLASLELDLTPNRPDALSHIGIAREIALKTGRKLKIPQIFSNGAPPERTEIVKVIIDDPIGCPRYIAGIVKNVKVGPSPKWMVDLLKAAGQRSINNIVDISNFVLLEMGHPTHIFDYDQLSSNTILIRRAQKGEFFITLDEEKHELDNHHLLITDGVQPVALAGIMGGINSAVLETTTTVLIESAYFDPITIRRGSKSLGMLTEASRRFERGADSDGTVTAFWRIVDLLREYAGGELAAEVVDEYPNKILPPTIQLRKSELDLISGCQIKPKFIEHTLLGLEIKWKRLAEGVWQCIPPGFRPDLEREIDLIEEIIRVFGYDSIHASQRFNSLFNFTSIDPQKDLALIHQTLTGIGYRQCFNNSLQSQDYSQSIGKQPVSIKNPLNRQMSVLRTSLLPGLLQTIDFNIKNGNKDLLLYEIGQVHTQESGGFEGIDESMVLCGLAHGLVEEKDIHLPQSRPQSLYSLKGHLEVIFQRTIHSSPQYIEYESPEYEICYQLLLKGKTIGTVGKISAEYIQKLNLEMDSVYGFELEMDRLIEIMKDPILFKSISVFPSIKRDLNFILENSVKSNAVVNTILNTNRTLVKDVKPIDVFKYTGVGEDKKSIVFHIVFQSHARTLEDKEVNSIISEIVSVVSKQFSAKLRA